MNSWYILIKTRSPSTSTTCCNGFWMPPGWRNKYIPTESKVRIYKTCVRPILIYVAATRVSTLTTKHNLRTTEIRTLRSIANISLRDRIRNKDIRKMCKVQDVVQWTRTRRRNWHDRMTDNRLENVVKLQKPTSGRLSGQPPKIWHESCTNKSHGKPWIFYVN